jgi:nicotinamidase-related amidase
MGDYKVLVVVDIQNCFIQGGSLGSTDIEDLKKYIDLVKEVDKKISQNNYDLVVFSKDIHPLNHSSLFDNMDAQHGVFTYHCRDTNKNCIKDTRNPAATAAATATTYMSSAAKEMIKDILCETQGILLDTEHFYDKKNIYQEEDYNFYNPLYRDYFKNLLKKYAREQVKKETDNYKKSKKNLITLGNLIEKVMDDKKYKIDKEKIKTLEDLLRDYISNPELDDDSKGYLRGLLRYERYKKLKVQGLDLNYLFYGTSLKDIIYALNTKETNSEIGITQEEHIDEPNYNDTAYNVDNLAYKTRNANAANAANAANTRFISIAKGQYCDYESYSAFNYHTKIEKDETNSIIYDVFGKYDSSLNKLEPLPAEKRYSTGLFEYILKSFNEEQSGSKTNINIDVCGLVTNICVVNTVHQGIAMWEKVYKEENKGITCKFNLLEYLSIPLSVTVPIPYFNYDYAQQINKEKDLGKMLLQVNNLKTLLTTKFGDDVLKTNPSINGEISYTVDYDVGSKLIFIHNFIHIDTPPISGGKKPKAAPKKAAKAAPKKAAKAAPKTANTAKAAPKRTPKKAKAAPKTPKAAP